MAKKRVFENYRITIVPDFWLGTDHQKRIAVLNSMAKEIKRHVDGIETCEIKYDKVFRCSLCDEEWETVLKNGRPECCRPAMEEWAKEKGRMVCTGCGGDGSGTHNGKCLRCYGKGHEEIR